jgi:hypothetical protein
MADWLMFRSHSSRETGRFRRRAVTVGASLLAASGFATLGIAGTASGTAGAASPPFLSQFTSVTTVASTVPHNGDVNPYGIVTVPMSTGKLVAGDTLVSNFNARSNLQGTGSTIVQISPSGTQKRFAHIQRTQLPGRCPGGIGLTTALTVLGDGYVVVGSLPDKDAGTATATPEAGCLIVLDPNGQPVETWPSSQINGPWDMTMVQSGHIDELFVTNVLNGTVAAAGQRVNGGTVVRLDIKLPKGKAPVLFSSTTVAKGFTEQLNTSALVLGPTGDAVSASGTLYVADTVNNRIATVPDATTRTTPLVGGGHTLTSGGSLNGPLGMALAPNGDILTVNGGDGNAVETNPSGKQVDTVQIDPLKSGGDLFGLIVAPNNDGVLFVDDGDNTLKLFGP